MQRIILQKLTWRTRSILGGLALAAALGGYALATQEPATRPTTQPAAQLTLDTKDPLMSETTDPAKLTSEQWREKLSADEYRVLREKGTEPAFANEYWDEKSSGTYTCAGCGQPLFDASTK